MKKILIVLLLTLIYSCGARKVEKNKEDIDVNSQISKTFEGQKTSDTKISEGVTTTTESTTKIVDNNAVTTEETTYEQSDSSKPGSIIDSSGKKTIIENVKVTTKKSTKKNDTKSEETKKSTENKNAKIDSKEKEISKSKEDSKSGVKSVKDSKQIVKESWSVFNLFWLLIPIAIVYIGYRLYKKYRSVIPI